jgi:plasmid stabilization system protein ParE
MARFLAWSPEAAEDVERIALYIERDSIHYARAVASRIVATAESIPENPELGRLVPEINDPECRERFVHKYRVIYHVEAERILIVAVIHGSRDFEQQISRITSV